MRRTAIKICGITIKEQAVEISRQPIDAMGFVIYNKSPRFIQPADVKAIVNQLPPFIKRVGVLVNESIESVSTIHKTAGLDLIQLSGDESPDYCAELTAKGISWLKTIRVKDQSSLANLSFFENGWILLDAWSKEEFGGTGKSFDWQIISEGIDRSRIVLAGGITPENAAIAIKTVQPYAIDVSSGVENSPGNKSIEKVKKLIKATEDVWEMD